MESTQHRLRIRAAIVVVACVIAPASVRAGGIEQTSVGARAIGRGGALAASAEGFDALRYDPARLAIGERTVLGADAQLIVDRTCFRREDEDGTTYRTVCNDALPTIVPQLGARVRVSRRVGLGFGILPPGGLSGIHYGDPRDGTIAVDGQREPSPVRYALVTADNLAFFPTVGVGVEAHPKVRLGASFGSGVFLLDQVVFAAGVPGAGPELDIRTALSGVDAFVPRVSIAIDVEPVRGFGIASVTTYTDDVRARSAMFLSGTNAGQGFSTRVDGVRVTQPLGFSQTLAIRYAHPRFDAEIDGVFEGNGRARDVVVDIPDDATIPVDGTLGGQPLSALPDEQRVPRRWRNQWIVRAGVEGVIVPNRLRLRSGFSFESNGVRHGYESVDNLSVRAFGVHGGLSVDVHEKVELTVGYARLFRPRVHVAPSDARLEQNVGARPGGLADDHVYVNGGTYRSGLHVIAGSIVIRPGRSHEESR